MKILHLIMKIPMEPLIYIRYHAHPVPQLKDSVLTAHMESFLSSDGNLLTKLGLA